MVEVSNELIYKLVLEIQSELTAVREEQALTSRKIGAMAESMVSMNKRLDDLGQQMRMVALAVDEHTTRLEHIEQRLGIGTPAN